MKSPQDEAERKARTISLGRRLAAAREARGLTQEEVANLIGGRAPQVSRWERGEVAPEVHYAAPLADALGTTTDALLRDDSVAPEGLAKLFSDRSVLTPPLTDAEYAWCMREVRNHGGDMDAFGWLQAIRQKRSGLTAEDAKRQSEATGAARVIGIHKGVPKRRPKR